MISKLKSDRQYNLDKNYREFEKETEGYRFEDMINRSVGDQQRFLQVTLTCSYSNIADALKKEDELRDKKYHGDYISEPGNMTLSSTVQDNRACFRIYVTDFAQFPKLRKSATDKDKHKSNSKAKDGEARKGEYLDPDQAEAEDDDLAGDVEEQSDPTRFWGFLDSSLNAWKTIVDVCGSDTILDEMAYVTQVAIGRVYVCGWGGSVTN